MSMPRLSTIDYKEIFKSLCYLHHDKIDLFCHDLHRVDNRGLCLDPQDLNDTKESKQPQRTN